MKLSRSITPCLWFDGRAEEAAEFYTGIFPNSRITQVSRYGEVGQEIHGNAPGSVMTVSFELDGQPFTGLNGGPHFRFNEAVSFQLFCETQDEIDYFWEKLSDGGDPQTQACGWLKDRFGLSWQVIPTAALDLMGDAQSEGSRRATAAMFRMKKLDIAALKRAYEGSSEA
jgi:predicted 3-demethylubiquinone-9 3-methyltransferase (glyoxalase superfamily)